MAELVKLALWMFALAVACGIPILLFFIGLVIEIIDILFVAYILGLISIFLCVKLLILLLRLPEDG